MVAEKSMAMGSGRSKPPLHNFTLPYGLKWGNQKFLRCGKLDSDGEIAAIHRRRGSDERVGNFRRADVENGIAAVRKKLMNDLQAETDKMKDAILRTGLEEEEERRPAAAEAAEQRYPPPTTVPAVAPPSETTTDAADSARRWNLRARRSGTKHPNGFSAVPGESNPGLKVDVTIPNAFSPVKSENKSPRLRSIAAAAGGGGGGATVAGSSSGQKRERAKFSIALSRREIEEDFAAIIHHRPPRRSKKRAKYVQKNLDNLFPGLWLTEITPDLYKVPEDQ
ncbi:PREDICTED: uncharacterized protein LOC109161160 isoform X1 [Ipomoea nil]|uniref:uncharacterized protein LOC109161160 isoform X1 n=1 Tax=Ipomoea nil TaxID=35883 RepID=UPI0009012303|nr:PREDICTED: uncharacterized protein LOC109161160 isoform X1 [Ipomoea nil]XP_019165057.1 PREDICTED: uncharacterized protein LOC109161160 isoform X1 [Ipomoea nil]